MSEKPLPPEPEPDPETLEETARRIMRETAHRRGARLHPSEPVPVIPPKPGGPERGGK